MNDFSLTTTTPEKTPAAREIGICGTMTIHHADEIRTAMLEALIEADEVRMEMTQVKAIDLVGLQLLCSAHQTSIVMNKRFRLCGCCGASVNKTIEDSGFRRLVGCAQDADHSCIWIQGGK